MCARKHNVNLDYDTLEDLETFEQTVYDVTTEQDKKIEVIQEDEETDADLMFDDTAYTSTTTTTTSSPLTTTTSTTTTTTTTTTSTTTSTTTTTQMLRTTLIDPMSSDELCSGFSYVQIFLFVY